MTYRGQIEVAARNESEALAKAKKSIEDDFIKVTIHSLTTKEVKNG